MPRVRRLLHPGRRADADARPRRAPGEHRVPLGHRLCRPLPVLHEHLRHALDPRARPGHRHRAGHQPPRSRRVGHLGRRRLSVDRRQPPDPRPAPQRAAEHLDVQQPDLRADQGAVLAHLRGGQGDQVHPVRLLRHPVQPGQPGPGGRGHLRGPHPRHGPGPHAGDLPAGPRAQRGRLRRGPAELQRLQRRGLREDHRQRGALEHAHPAGARRADRLRRRGRAARGGAAVRRRPRDRLGGRGRHGRAADPRREAGRPRVWPSRCRAWPAAPTSRRRSASSGPSSAPSTASRCPSRSCRPRRSAAWATSAPCCAPAPAGRSSRSGAAARVSQSLRPGRASGTPSPSGAWG